MTIKQLKKALRGLDPEMKIMFSKDEEGNYFHDTAEVALISDMYKHDPKKLLAVVYPINTKDDLDPINQLP